MRLLLFCLLILLSSPIHAKETIYIASTPANDLVRKFLGISLKDSIDFIRWKITLNDRQYNLHCQYGIGKPNTNGFINGGQTIDLAGSNEFKQTHYVIKTGQRRLHLLIINNDLLQIADEHLKPSVGNGGWSYTLNNLKPAKANMQFAAVTIPIKDSVVFDGRTPCAVPGVVEPGRECYKLKWRVVLFKDSNNKPGGFKIFGTTWRDRNFITGKWSVIKNKYGQIVYQLVSAENNITLNLLAVDKTVLLFTDKEGNCLVGNDDFSYTLNLRS